MKRPGWMTSWRLLVLAVALVAGWVVWLTVSLGDREQQATVESQRADTAERSLDQLAEDVARVCAEGGPPAERLGTVCLSADELAERLPTPERGPVGERGDPGRGIASTHINGGELVVSYSDGTTRTVGPVAGPTGPPGPAGRSITSTSLDGTDLVITYSDDATEVVGRVVGGDGTDGDDGRSITSVTTTDGRLTVTYSDGTTEDAGPLLPGPRGERGPEGKRGPQGEPGPTCPDGYELRDVVLVDSDGGTYDGVGCIEPDPESSEPPR